MASPKRLRLYGDSYPGVSEKLLRDLNRMFESRDKEYDDLKAEHDALRVEHDALKTRVDDAGIP